MQIYAEHNDIMKTTTQSFRKLCTSQFICKGLCVRGSWRLNKDCNIMTSPAPPDIAVCRSRSPDAQQEARGPTPLDAAFFTASFHQRVSKLSGGPEGPFYLVVASSATSCLKLIWSPNHWLPVFTELYNSSIAHLISPHNLPSGCVTSAVLGMACLIVIERK